MSNVVTAYVETDSQGVKDGSSIFVIQISWVQALAGLHSTSLSTCKDIFHITEVNPGVK